MSFQNNRVHLIGNLGFDPEVREVANGRKVARMSLATNDTYKNADGEFQDDTQWHNVISWGKTAEQVEKVLRKGCQICMDGKLVHRTYEAKDGTKRYVTEIVMRGFKLVREPHLAKTA